MQSNLRLKISFVNAENLFILFDENPPENVDNITENEWQNLNNSIYQNKPLKKCQDLATSILDMSPDIQIICEVGGAESLENFNRLFLDSQYSVALVEGNSNRNIDIGYLVRKGLPFYFDLFSNKNRPINFLYPHEIKESSRTSSHKFSRDVSELRLFYSDRESPFLIFLAVHLKSQLDPENIDRGGTLRRAAEFKALLEIYRDLSAKYQHCGFVIGGDFNGRASRIEPDEEFHELYKITQLQDIFDLDNYPIDDRTSFYQIRPSGGSNESRQIDYFFLCPNAQRYFHNGTSGVYRYKDHSGHTIKKPISMEEKLALPSDHYPIFFSFHGLPEK